MAGTEVTRRNKLSSPSEERSLLVIILDVSPAVWEEREVKRRASDKARLAAGKTSSGPATIQEVLAAVHAFGGAYDSLQRDSILMVVAVAGNESAVVFPRKNDLQKKIFEEGGKVDIRKLNVDLTVGVAEVATIAANKAEKAANTIDDASLPGDQQKNAPMADTSSAAMAAALSLALCCINRFLVASGGGVSAIDADTSAAWNRQDDEGVLSLLGGSDSKKRSSRGSTPWSPRVLMIQASNDRTRDYNAFMNCTFAASKHNVVLDGCFIHSGITTDDESSSFLEQACDRTGGVFLAPKNQSQVGGALTEILVSVFLSPPSARSGLNLPALNKVDFRARCFETGESVDMAHVCNQCLSTFKKRPTNSCPTCGAEIKSNTADASGITQES